VRPGAACQRPPASAPARAPTAPAPTPATAPAQHPPRHATPARPPRPAPPRPAAPRPAPPRPSRAKASDTLVSKAGLALVLRNLGLGADFGVDERAQAGLGALLDDFVKQVVEVGVDMHKWAARACWACRGGCSCCRACWAAAGAAAAAA
jgi:hypothetical protein